MVMYLACNTFMENRLTTLDCTYFLKQMPENQGHSGRYLYMYRLRDPKMCSQTKFGIPRSYAGDTVSLDLMAVVKVCEAP